MKEKNGDLKYKTDNAIDEAYRRGFTDGAMQGGADRHEQREKTLEALMSEYKRGYEDGLGDTKSAYKNGLDDAWETAKQIVSKSSAKMSDIFGEVYAESVFEKFTADQAMQKIKDYDEPQTDEIKVGDEVKVYDDCIGIVTRHAPQARTCYVMYRDGSCGEEELTDCKKTGNHSMSLDKWLEQMRKESHEV